MNVANRIGLKHNLYKKDMGERMFHVGGIRKEECGMPDFDDEVVKCFLEKQLKLFPEPVAESMEEAQNFLEECMAVVVNSPKEVWEYFDEEGVDVEGMDEEDILDAQRKVQVKLGLIAVSEKLLSPEQADKINNRQAFEDKRFGDIAVEMGYLTESQVSRLLQLQGNPYLTFIQAMTEMDFCVGWNHFNR